MTRAVLAALFLALGAASAQAQEVSPLWITVGGASGTVRGDCQECEQDFPYRHSGAITGNVGYRVTNRMDAGADVFWMRWDGISGKIEATHVDAVAQFRPWSSKGFFVKGGAGMAFIRNWVKTLSNSDNSKALSVVIGGGWEFRPSKAVGLQLFATQHVGALGDLQTPDTTFADVTGNFWSVGASIVIR